VKGLGPLSLFDILVLSFYSIALIFSGFGDKTGKNGN